MFVSAKHRYDGDLNQGFSLTILDTDFEEVITNLPIQKMSGYDEGWRFDILTPLVECYQRRDLNVASNMSIWLTQHQNATNSLDLNLIIRQHPILQSYRQDIEKYLTLL